MLKDTLPEEHIKLIALNELKANQRVGKINARVLKVLFKVVIDDIYYEIANIDNYINYLKSEIKRLETAESYFNKMNQAKKEEEIEYFKNGISFLLSGEETIENFQDVLHDYKEALNNKESMVDKLYNEIKIVKKLRI